MRACGVFIVFFAVGFAVGFAALHSFTMAVSETRLARCHPGLGCCIGVEVQVKDWGVAGIGSWG